MCVRSGRDLSLKQKHRYTNWPQKAPRSLRAAYYTGRLHEWMHTSSTQGDAREGNLILNLFFLVNKTKASTVVGKGEECVPCDPGYELRKGGSLTKECEENTRRWDRKKRQAWMNVISCTFWRVYWSVVCCTSRSITISIPGTWRYKKCLLLTKKKAHNSMLWDFG